MASAQRLPRAIVVLVIAVVLVLFGTIQTASMAFLHEPGTASSLVPISFGRSVYRFLDRVAPAAYVEETLANDALARGDLDAAQRYAVRLPASGRRDDLLGRIAEARGQFVLAREYYFVAPDVERMQVAIMHLAATDAPGAYALEVQFAQKLADLRTHPDALADAYYTAGTLAEWLREPRLAIENLERALALAPFDEKFLLQAGTDAYLAGSFPAATGYFNRGIAVNPACGDCIAGLGLIALANGDRAQARQYADRARAADPQSKMLLSLDEKLHR